MDIRMLSPSELIETELSSCLVKCFSDQVTPCRRDMVIHFSKDLGPRIQWSVQTERKTRDPRTIANSPLISGIRASESSFFPSPRVELCISVPQPK